MTTAQGFWLGFVTGGGVALLALLWLIGWCIRADDRAAMRAQSEREISAGRNDKR